MHMSIIKLIVQFILYDVRIDNKSSCQSVRIEEIEQIFVSFSCERSSFLPVAREPSSVLLSI